MAPRGSYPMKYGKSIRLLHSLLALGITTQLLLSLVMEQPRPGRVFSTLQSTSFTAHEYIGVALLAVLVVHWALTALGRVTEGLGHFLPWFTPARRQRLAAELRELLRLRIDDPERQNALAGAIQGLGLLIALCAAITGTAIYLGMAGD